VSDLLRYHITTIPGVNTHALLDALVTTLGTGRIVSAVARYRGGGEGLGLVDVPEDVASDLDGLLDEDARVEAYRVTRL
jgi:hypothetical protein